ncbi:MAG TPA: RDD family protein [Planctomycetaceae bacterium]|nr:RDD family protein [Planctomycetaceae bacterium]
MTIEFNCPHCQKFLKTADDKAGLTVPCPGCRENITIPSATPVPAAGGEFMGWSEDGPAAPTVQMKNCPVCGESIRAAARKCRHCGEVFEGGPEESEQGRGDVQYAGFWLRVVACIIDVLVLIIPSFVLGAAVGIVVAAAAAAGGDQQAGAVIAQLLAQAAGIVMGWLYGALMESSSYQATVGKMALGLKVTDLDGHRITFLHATGRHFAKFLSYLICGIGYIMAGLTEKKQALHDMVASTLVVRS